MANVLIMDDEPLSLRRLFNVLCDDGQHALETADDLLAGVKIVEKLGSTLDLLVIDVSMFQRSATELLDLFANACPRAKVLVLSPLAKPSRGTHYSLLRKPFSDVQLVQTVDQILTMRQAVAAHCDVQRKPQGVFRPDHRPNRIRASAQ